MGVVLNVLNVVAPGSHLRCHVKKLSDDSLEKMRVMNEVHGAAVRPAIGGLRFFRHFGKLGLQNQNRPDKNHCAQNHVRRPDAKGLVMKVCGVRSRCLEPGNLLLVQFDPGEDEDGSPKHANHGAQGVKRLREIEPALGIFADRPTSR